MRSEHQTEESLHAWLDNELSSRESVLVGEHVEGCDSCSATLAECRETRATVSYLLQSYDSELERVPAVPREARARLSLSARVPSAPIIGHIVANSRPVRFWSGAKTLAPVAAAAMLIVGGAALVMMRSYHVVAGSVGAFASVSRKPFVTIEGTVLNDGGRPVGGITVLARGTSASAVTDAKGNFQMYVPRTTRALVTQVSNGYGSTALAFISGDGDSVGVVIKVVANLRRLNPYVINAADSVPLPSRGAATPPVPKK